jgi:hypothetical protein
MTDKEIDNATRRELFGSWVGKTIDFIGLTTGEQSISCQYNVLTVAFTDGSKYQVSINSSYSATLDIMRAPAEFQKEADSCAIVEQQGACGKDC